MSKFMLRPYYETETAKQDKIHGELLEVLANHILTMTDEGKLRPRLGRVSSSFRSPDLLRKRS
jgi:hypothetical protein